MVSGNPDSSVVLPDLMQKLRAQLTLPLPGEEHQFRMAHISRLAKMALREDVRPAAVLLLLFERDQQWNLVLIRRKSIQGDVHGGQISFPGGRSHNAESIIGTALRESAEEIGSRSSLITVLGQLTDLHIPVSNHLVTPVVGYLEKYNGWHLQESEVDLVLEVHLNAFLHAATFVISSIQLSNGLTLQNVPCYQIGEHLIWGATAMILSEFTSVLKEIGYGS